MLDMVCVLCGKKKIPLCKLDNLILQSLHLGPKPPKNIYFQLFRLQFRWYCCLINSYHIPNLHYLQFSRSNFIYWMQYWKAIFFFVLLISLLLLPIRPMRLILSTLSWTVFKLFFRLRLRDQISRPYQTRVSASTEKSSLFSAN